MKKIIFLWAVMLASASAWAQSYTISGTVTDEKTGETLIGVTVMDLRSGKGCVTNAYGHYSLTLKKDTVELRISYVGYKNDIRKLWLDRSQSINTALNPNVELKEVTIRAERVSDVKSSQMSAVEIPVEQIKSVPVLFGEADVVKALQLMPGVQSGSEGNSGMYVRGGGPDENLFLLDGVPMYNVSHMGGFFSAFNTDAVKNVTLYKGSFPARFSGRVSSVLDVTTNNGDNHQLHGNASVGFISAKFSLEGPLANDKTTFCVSGRRTYADFLLQPLVKKLADQKDYKIRAGYYFYDLNGKLTHKFSDKSRLYASYYMGDDALYSRIRTLSTDVQDQYLNFNNDWGNIVASVRWNYELSPKLFMNLTGAYTRYRNGIMVKYETETTSPEGEGQSGEFQMDYTSGIRDWTAKADLEYTPNPDHCVKFGGSSIFHRFTPEVASMQMDIVFEMDSTVGGVSVLANEMNLFAEDDWTVSPMVKVNYGLNVSGFTVDGKFYPTLQPRLSGRLLMSDDLSVKLGYSHMTQNMHLLSTTGVSMPTDLWVPVTRNIAPMISDQIAAGVFYKIEKVCDLSVEAYYKKMSNLLEYKDGASFFGSSEGWEEKVVLGDGWVYGVELLAQRTVGQLTGWVGYTWSKTMRLFDRPGQVLNEGLPFPAKYDRRHDLSIVASYKITDNIDVSATWVYSTGNAATLSMEEFSQAYDTPSGYEYEPPESYGFGMQSNDGSLSHPGNRNNFRMPNYHRMDLSANFHKQFAKRNMSRTINISIYNVYNRKNPYMVYESSEYHYGSYNAALVQVSVFPILPSVAYTLKF